MPPEANPDEVVGEVPPIASADEQETDEQQAPEETPAEETPPADESVDEAPEPDEALEKLKAEIRKEYEAELSKLEKRQMYLQRQMEKMPRQSLPEIPDVETEAPKESDFENFEDYDKALRRWEAQVEINKTLRDYKAKAEETGAEQSLKDFTDDAVTDGMERYSDFADVAMADTVPITQDMLGIMQSYDMENPADIAYYLGKNQKECTAISRMNKTQATRALIEVEAKVKDLLAKGGLTGNDAKPPAAAAPKQSKKISNAPPPTKPQGSGGVISKDPRDMTQEEFEQWYNERYPDG